MNDEITIYVRDYDPRNDSHYIHASWTRYSWYSPPSPHTLPRKKFFKEKTIEIDHLLKSGIVKIACTEDDPNVIAGYIVVKDNEIKWLCVKKIYRNEGIEEILVHSIKDLI